MNIKKSYIKLVSLIITMSILTACGSSGSSSENSVPTTVDFEKISYQIPNGVNVLDSQVDSKSKLLTLDQNESVAGFLKVEEIAVEQKSTKTYNKTYGEKLYAKLNSNTSFGTLSLLSSQKITSPYIYTISHYKVSTYTAMTPLELSEKTLYILSENTEIGTEISSENDEKSTEFRLVYVEGFYNDIEFHIASIVAESDYDANEYICTDITNGARVTEKGASITSQSQEFIAQSGNNKADFLFVIDDSISMSDDQDALSKSASDFVKEIGSSGLTYRSAIITTSYQPTNSYYDTWDAYHILDEVGIIENNEELLKEKLVAGTNGSTTETGIYNAEKALLSIEKGDSEDGRVTELGMPLSDATLSVIIISDEPSQYVYRAGKEFNVLDNLFVKRDIRVYSIIESFGYDGSFDQYNISQYDDLAYETGGSIADIANRNADGELDYSEIMKQIAKDAGGAASSFVLEHPAISVNEVTIDGISIQNDTNNGYTYNPSSNSIVLHGNALPENNFTLKVNYTYS